MIAEAEVRTDDRAGAGADVGAAGEAAGAAGEAAGEAGLRWGCVQVHV